MVIHKLFFLFVLLFHTVLSAQSEIKWGDFQYVDEPLESVLAPNPDEFYTVSRQDQYTHSFTLSKFSNLSLTHQTEIKVKNENGFGLITYFMLLNNLPVAFIYNDKEGDKSLYLQKYDSTCKSIASPVKIDSFSMPNEYPDPQIYHFAIYASPDMNYFCVEHREPDSNPDAELRYAYQVFYKDLSLVSSGSYTLDYEFIKSQHVVSNSGAYFITSKIYHEEEDELMTKNMYLDKVIIKPVTDEDQEEITLELEDKRRIYDITFSCDEKRVLTFFGMYSGGKMSEVKGISGLFYLKYDFSKKLILAEDWQEFKLGFVLEGWSDKKKAKYEKNPDKTVSIPEIYDYSIRGLLMQKDGSCIGILEQNHMEEVRSRNGISYHYYSNDVIVSKISREGSFEWLKKIHKNQFSKNDRGYYSSVSAFVSDGKLAILFNDNIKNYDDEGVFQVSKAGVFLCETKQRNPLVSVDFDLENGESSRKVFITPKESRSYAVPGKFIVDEFRRELLLIFTNGVEERYGVLHFE